jgi:hypothetical protein
MYRIKTPQKPALQRNCTEKSKQIFPEMKLWGLAPISEISYLLVNTIYCSSVLIEYLQNITDPAQPIFKLRSYD